MRQLTNDQEKACDVAMDWLTDRTSKYLVIQGAAGTGKSTLVDTFLERVQIKGNLLASILGARDSNQDWEVEMMATTNKAAGVLSEMSSGDVKTVHSFLRLVPRKDFTTGKLHFIRGRDAKVVHNRLLIIDEASFISDELFTFLDQGTSHCKIILVGDQYQLAPVDQKEQIMDKIICPKASLEQVVRHDSDIANLGAQCRKMVKTNHFTGIRPNDKDIIWLDGQDTLDMVNEIFTDPSYDMDTARILSWTNKQVVKYNTHIRVKRGLSAQVAAGETLITNKPILGSGGKTFASTDTRVRVRSVIGEETLAGVPGLSVFLYGASPSYFLPNDQAEAGKLLRRLKKAGDMHTYFTVKETWLDLRPVYASTVHKSQGSTFDTVFVDLTDIGKCPVASEVARMMYVGVTRAAKKVIFYGKLPAHYGGILHGIKERTA